MFARGISSFTRTWMNLRCQKRLQSTSATTYSNPNPNIDIEARDEIHHPRSNARGMPGGGMLQLRFDRYIILIWLYYCMLARFRCNIILARCFICFSSL